MDRRPARARRLHAAALASSIALLAAARSAEAQPRTTVIINSAATPVFFNDGDTFRPLAGAFAGTPSRLGGFNTLESYGPVHQWKGWTFKELYVNAKQATLEARRGTWSCSADPSDRDGYGRMLADCPDLAEHQIRQGLAHAYSVDGPSSPTLLAAQREAIVHRRGMWAKGVPAYVMTSLHSANEGYGGDTYNRLISTVDGQSAKWVHQDVYRECQKVCHVVRELRPEAAREAIAELRRDATTAGVVRGLEDPYLVPLLNDFVETGRVPEIFPPSGIGVVRAKLEAMRARGDFARVERFEGSCMIYVIFERRYRAKPECLKW